MAPGGRQPACMENIKTQRLPALKKAIKSPPQCVSNSEAASGLLTGYRARMRLQACLAPRTVCGCSTDAVCRGRIPKVGGTPPAFGGVFLPRFFLRYRRKNRAPGGRKQVCLEEIRIRKPPTTPASKLAPCVVSASAAASGQHTRSDDGCSHKPAWHPVQCAAVVPTPYQGWVLRAGPPALSGVFLPLFFLRRRRKNGAPGGR